MSHPIPGSPDFVERLLADRIGLDVASVGPGVIQQGVQARMKQLRLRRRTDYERILLEPTDELQALIEEVVIPESWFFRDDRPFAALRALFREAGSRSSDHGPLAVLCLPCAGGEEPYSVVMTALEAGLSLAQFAVVAVDISGRSLERAARGVYGPNSFRGMSDPLRQTYFEATASPGRLLLRAQARARVEFRQGNILDADLLADRGPFDIVFCRNLLIYFDEIARTRAFAQLDRLTAREGYLFLGHADRPPPAETTSFAPHGEPGCFLYRKHSGRASIAAVATPPRTPRPPLVPPLTQPPRRTPADTRGTASPDSPARVPSPAAPAPAPAPVPGPVPPRTVAARPASNRPPERSTPRDQIMAEASDLANRGRYEEATRLVRAQLGQGVLDAPAHFLLGMIYQAAGDRTAAESELSKTVYLDPNHDEALVALAGLARRRGDVAGEAMFRRRAERILSRKGGA